jgi:ribonuclease HI
MGRKNRFYVVWEGRKTGIFTDWSSCNASVSGFAGAKYMAFDTGEEAEKALKSNYWKFVKKGGADKTILKPAFPHPGGEALTVDAACSGNPGIMEYRGVWLSSGTEYFRMGPYPEGTVNIGEFLAIVHGLALLKKEGLACPVYSDSKTAIKWVKDARANTKLTPSEINEKLFELIERAEKWLKENTWSNPLLKWETKHWGEIPADFGRK